MLQQLLCYFMMLQTTDYFKCSQRENMKIFPHLDFVTHFLCGSEHHLSSDLFLKNYIFVERGRLLMMRVSLIEI
jgi:hypothetical protein